MWGRKREGERGDDSGCRFHRLAVQQLELWEVDAGAVAKRPTVDEPGVQSLMRRHGDVNAAVEHGVKEREGMITIRTQISMGVSAGWQIARLDDGHDVSDRSAITKEAIEAHARVLSSDRRGELSQEGEASQVITVRDEVDQGGRSGQ